LTADPIAVYVPIAMVSTWQQVNRLSAVRLSE